MNDQTDTVITAKMDALADGGHCIGTVIDPDTSLTGKKVFIPFTIPGETVSARVTEEKKSFLKACLLEVVTPAPERVTAPCPVFGECGGCSLQQMSIKAERKNKVKMITSALEKHARLSPKKGVIDISAELPDLKYRNRVTFHIDNENKIGFYKSGTGEVVETEECLLVMPEISKALSTLKNCDISGKFFGSVVIELTEQKGVFLVLRMKPGHKKVPPTEVKKIKEAFPDFSIYRGEKELLRFLKSQPASTEVPLPYGHFSQVNNAGNEILKKTVSDCIKSGPVTELYAGAGNFTFLLAEKGISVTAVEINKALTESGQKKARSRNLNKLITFFCGSTEKFVKKNKIAKTLLLDPPRSGAQFALEKLTPADVRKIVYVSCNLPSLCRDLRILAEKGYKLETTYFLDMFPKTGHVETVSVLVYSSDR